MPAIFVISIFCYERGGRRPPEQPKGPWGPKGARRRGAEHPELIVSQCFLAPMGVLPRSFLHIDDFVRILMLHFPKSTIKNIFLEIQKHTSFLNSLFFNCTFFDFRKKYFWAYFLESVTLAIFSTNQIFLKTWFWIAYFTKKH